MEEKPYTILGSTCYRRYSYSTIQSVSLCRYFHPHNKDSASSFIDNSLDSSRRITYYVLSRVLNPDNDVYLSSTEIKGAQTGDTATTVTIIDHFCES